MNVSLHSNPNSNALPPGLMPAADVSREDLLLINRLLLDLYRLKTPEEQNTATLVMLKALVPSILATWTQFNLRTRELQFTTEPHIPTPPEVHQMVARVAHQSPFAIYFSVSGDHSWRMLTDFMSLEEFSQTELSQLMLAPAGCMDMISTVLEKVDDDQFSLTLCRVEPYTERDRAVLNLVYPHLNLSYYNLHAYERAQKTLIQYQAVIESAPKGYAFVQLDGKITWTTAKARELWQQHFLQDTTDKAGIPTSVKAWLNKSLNPHTRLLPAMENGLQTESSAGKLEMWLMPSPFEGFILSVSAIGPAPQPRFHPLPQLSSRENEALRWMTEGKRNSEIASILGISQRTAEKHVAEILLKLGVENRATAIVRAMEFCATQSKTV